MRRNPIRWFKGLFAPQDLTVAPAQLPPNVRVEMTEVPWGPDEIRRKKRLFWWIFSPVLAFLGLVVLKILSLYIGSWVAAAAFSAGNYPLMESAAKVQGIVNVIEPHRALHNLGVAYSMQGRYEEAREQLDDALWRATPPDVCLIRYDLARTWELESAAFEAEGDFEQAIRALDSGKKVLEAQEVECLPPEEESEDESEDEQSEDEQSEDEQSEDEQSEDEQSEDEQSEDEQSEDEQSEDEQSGDPSDPEQGDDEQNSGGGQGDEEQPSSGEEPGDDEQPSGGEEPGDEEQPSGGEEPGDDEEPSGGGQNGDEQDESEGEQNQPEPQDPGEGEHSAEVPEPGDGPNQDTVNDALQDLLERLSQRLEQLQGQQAGPDDGDDEAEQPEPDETGQQELPEVIENQGDRLQQIQDLLDQAWKERNDWDSADRAHNQEYSYTRRPW